MAQEITDFNHLFLHDVGMQAARDAGVPAYWVGCSNLGSGPELAQHVWQISDIIRGARQLVIVVSDPPDSQSRYTRTDELLKGWGSRVWTLPEVLLIPKQERILVFSRSHGNQGAEQQYRKHEFASKMTDWRIVRQLLDHFEGSLQLGRLQLVTIALQCFHDRQKGDYLPGDMSYAMMGLMLRRPNVVRSDSAFQAFARLSLANDNELLLERLICIMPKSPKQPWHDVSDEWNVNLWDIYPSTQVCGIGDHDTVLLDGAHAASIRWKSFRHVPVTTRRACSRIFARILLHLSPWTFITGLVMILTVGRNNYGRGDDDILSAFGGFFLAAGLLFVMLSPKMIRTLYSGKAWGQQAWFMGFEGYMPIGDIERHVFGANFGRLRWSIAGSPLSRHQPMQYLGRENRDPSATTLSFAASSPPEQGAAKEKPFSEECEGIDPTWDPAIAQRVKKAVTSKMGEEKIFTLIDTKTMVVTMFAALRPPVAVVLAGEEGGMKRALLCSYRYETQTLVRESVVRMETPVVDSMQRLGRFRLGLQSSGW